MSDCVLGCPESQAFITDRCGGKIVCELDSLSALTYGRTMDDTSEAQAVPTVGGSDNSVCCECLGNVRSWVHSLTVFRDGKRAWFGPVVNVLYKRAAVVVTARDVTAWLDKRAIHNNYSFVNERLDVVVAVLLEDALSDDDPCNLLGSAIIGNMPTLVTKEVLAYDGYAGDVFRDLSRNILDFTAVGTSIVFAEKLTYGPFARLSDEHFLVDIEVEERGLEAATKWDVLGNGVRGSAGGVDPFYGLLEGVASEDSLLTVADADLSAAGRLEASNPAPLYVNVPDNARLSPDAPVCMEQLVPGTLIGIDVRGLCRPTDYLGRLTAVSVSHTPDEAVGITVSPVGTTQSTQSRSPR